MTKYRFSDGAAVVFGGSGGLGTGIVDLLSKCGTDVAFTYPVSYTHLTLPTKA